MNFTINLLNLKVHFYMEFRIMFHRPYACSQYNLTLIQRMQLFWLNALIVELPYKEYEILFPSEEALDHYLFLNPYLWDE